VFEKDREREKRIRLIFVNKPRKVYLIPFTDIVNQTLSAGGAPVAFVNGSISAFILTDFGVFEEGIGYGVEWKSKATWTVTKWRRGEPAHGIGKLKYWSYLQQQIHTGLKSLLVIDEGRTGEMLARSFDDLGTPWDHNKETVVPADFAAGPRPSRIPGPLKKGVDPCGMVYWPRRTSRTICHCSKTPE
jgi:hypothetical protein